MEGSLRPSVFDVFESISRCEELRPSEMQRPRSNNEIQTSRHVSEKLAILGDRRGGCCRLNRPQYLGRIWLRLLLTMPAPDSPKKPVKLILTCHFKAHLSDVRLDLSRQKPFVNMTSLRVILRRKYSPANNSASSTIPHVSLPRCLYKRVCRFRGGVSLHMCSVCGLLQLSSA